MEKDFCFAIGTVKTTWSVAIRRKTSQHFASFCLKRSERKEKGIFATKEKIIPKECKNCPLGKKIKRGKRILPINIIFKNLKEK